MIQGFGRCIIFILGTFLCINAQSVNLSGVVSNSSGEVVSGAVVTLVGLGISDTTKADGTYSFNRTGTITAAPILPEQQNISLARGILSISLTGSSPLSIEVFDVRGQFLDRITERNATAGEYHFNVAHYRYAAKMLLLRVTVGRETATLRYMPAISELTGNQTTSISVSSGERLAKTKAVVDTLKVVASGYLATSVGIESYESEKNISLEMATALDKFSFFVTSMAGLQELSGSEDGFGGDLRFGKTGPGAGLLGADSICATLAEMSMPGASTKKWKAFLSAEEGVDGDTVNAIDRIGEGPWYDRQGRLVANNKSELLNERPINADEAIINDLPNEYGIPNHRPDPTRPIVDNHMTMTGSNAEGKLFTGSDGSSGGGRGFPGTSQTSEYGYTCDSWTSTTVQAKPRVGLCWPQSESMGGRGGMSNWISAMTASGCEAGIDLDESTMSGVPGVYTVGNGGGYGGFYCFADQP